MSQGFLKSFGASATGVLSGIAAVATVIAATVGVLSQFGYIGSRDAQKPVTVVTVPIAMPSFAISQPAQPVAPMPSAAATAAPQVAASPHPHHKHKPKPEAVADKSAPAQAKRLAPEDAAIAPAAPATTHIVSASAPSTAASISSAAAPQPAGSPEAQPSVAMLEPTSPVSLSGAWRDAGIGACHLINQSCKNFELTNYDPSTGEVMSNGMGTIDGNHVEIEFPRKRVSMDLHISPDGKTLYGKITRPMGVSRAMWFYIGTDCSKTS